jgi:hypothetical protein
MFGPPLPSKKYFILPPLPGKNKKRAFRPHYRFFLGTALTEGETKTPKIYKNFDI